MRRLCLQSRSRPVKPVERRRRGTNASCLRGGGGVWSGGRRSVELELAVALQGTDGKTKGKTCFLPTHAITYIVDWNPSNGRDTAARAGISSQPNY
jgi:hypothetical protein